LLDTRFSTAVFM